MKIGKLTKKELEKIKPILDDLEWDAYLPYKNINGGFAEAVMFDYDEDFIDVELKFGIKSDAEDVCYTEQYTIDRKTFILK